MLQDAMLISSKSACADVYQMSYSRRLEKGVFIQSTRKKSQWNGLYQLALEETHAKGT